MDKFRGLVRMAVLVLVFLLAGALPVQADYDAGQRAWDAGHPDEALSHWRAAAEADDRRAMLALGRLYRKGRGAPQNYVEAHKWLNLAASRGEEVAFEERDALAEKMTLAQVAVAQERAAAWHLGEPPPAPLAERGTAGDPEASPPLPGAIREAQSLLAALGYAPGSVDGIWGPRLAEAYRAFLADAGLPPEEIVTPAALRALRAAAKRRGEEAGSDAVADADSPRPAARPDVLHRAAKAGNLNGLKAALGAGEEVDARDETGRTALMHAVDRGYVLLVEPLLAAGANPDVPAPDGTTALFMAAAHGHTEIVARLVKAGADIFIRGPKGRTAVDVARAGYGGPDAAREKGEDPAVIALLDGKSWEEVRRQVERAERLAREWPRGKKFRDCEGCPELVVVPSGSFEMGSPSGESGRNDDEGPVHRVTISKPFAVGVYEVTRREWSRFVSESKYSVGDSCWTYEGGEWNWRSGRSWRNSGFSQSDAHPVVCVSRDDAQEFVRWLSGKTGAGYRLLSESEWEYVARGGTATAQYWGESARVQCEHATGADRSAKRRYRGWTVSSCDDGHVHTAPVGSFTSNGYGLYDVLGNVWESVEDCWHGSYRGAPSDGSAWTRTGDCDYHVLRGGSWDSEPRYLRSANRGWDDTGLRSSGLGFRVARTLD